MSEHQHIVLDDPRARAYANHIAAYIQHVGNDFNHESPRIDPQYDAVVPGLGAFGAVVYPGFEGLDPRTGQAVEIPRMIVPVFTWNQDPEWAGRWRMTYFAQWLSRFDPNAQSNMLFVIDRITTALRSHREVTVHAYGLGVFMVDRIGAAFSLSPELLHVLNQRAPFAPDDRDLRVPSQMVNGMNDNDLCSVAIDHLWHSLPPAPIILGKLFGNRVSRGQLYTFATSWLCKEIGNGGFAQFFENPTGDLAEIALEGLTSIGAHQHAQVLRKAMQVFGDVYPVDCRLRAEQLAANRAYAADQLDACNREFWSLLEGERGLETYMAAFIRQHPDQFLRAA